MKLRLMKGVALLVFFLAACARGATPAPLPIAVGSPQRDPAPRTVTIDYTPTVPTGAPVEGVCWTNSRAIASLGAWRCLVSDKIFDPCFQLPDGGVVCGANPATGDPGFLVKLTAPLPRPDLTPSSRARIWLLELADGTICSSTSEPSSTVEGKRIGYECSTAARGSASSADAGKVRVVVLGDLKEGTPWTAETARLSTGADGIRVLESDAVAVSRVWQFSIADDTTTVERVAPTTIIDYRPERPKGASRAGSCLTNSLAVPNRAAWRCTVESQILDPCFALDNGQHVVCNPNPLTGNPGVLVQLENPLPQPDLVAERESLAWMLELDDRTICNLAPSATGLVEGKRISYLCSEAGAETTVALLGEPRTGTIWTAEKATLSLRDGKLAATDTATVTIRTVVRGPLPYVPVVCDSLSEGMSEVLGAEATRSESPFIDPLTGAKGKGCQVSVTTGESNAEISPIEIVAKMLLAQGWKEDPRYRSNGPTANIRGFRTRNDLCILYVTRRPTQPDATLDPRPYPREQDLVSQPFLTLTLNCARDATVETAPEPTPRTPEPIVFEPDTTSGAYRRAISAGEIQDYIVRAFEGQVMLVDVSSPNDNVFLGVSGVGDGVPVVRGSSNAKHWQGQLPATQDYIIRVAARGEDTQFTLRIVIPVNLELSAESRSATVEGEVKPNQRLHYVLRAKAGETFSVNVESPKQNAFLAITGLDDRTTVVSSAAATTSWSGALPATQAYLIEVIGGDEPTTYTLNVSAN